MGLFDEIKGEMEAFSCFKKPNWIKRDLNNDGGPWRENDDGSLSKSPGSRQHAYKSIWEQSLDPLGNKRTKRGKSSKPETWSIDWKKWPPNFPPFPTGIKIPVKTVPQIDLRLSLSGRWDEIVHGTSVIPVNFESKKYFDNLGGHLNVAQSITFKVSPTSLLFLNTKPGQFYSVKLKAYNSGTIPRRVKIIPPANSCFTVIRKSDPEYAISPGCCFVVVVNYRPKTNESVNDSMVFHVDRDGAIVVPLISSSVPQPILEVEEWNCGCCVVGIPRTARFEIKNIGGEGRFWILSEREFNNEFLECYLKFKKDLIKESTRELVKLHTDAMDGNDSDIRPIVGQGEASGLIKRTRDSLDDEYGFGGTRKERIQPRIYTKCFKIQPTSFQLQRNQHINIKVRYLPNDANFHYEKLCIMCENGEVRWIAVKGLGIERNSDKLIEVKAHWTGPPVDLPSDPRTKFVMDCGDLIAGELANLNFSIVNKSCVPLYFFWSIRPVLTDPEASPENVETNIMDRFFETTMYRAGSDEDKNESFVSWTSKFPLTINPAQGMLEKKQETCITFTAECPIVPGYYACVISLFAEQVDDDSKDSVLEMLRDLDRDQLNRPISHIDLNTEFPLTSTDEKTYLNKDSKEKNLHFLSNENSRPNSNIKESTQTSRGKDFLEENAESEYEDDYVPLKDSIKEYKEIIGETNPATPTTGIPFISPDEMLLPLVVAKRSSGHLRGNRTRRKSRDSAAAKYKRNVKSGKVIRGGGHVSRHSNESFDAAPITEKKESINIHFLAEANDDIQHDREMNQGHGVYEELKNYTENIAPQYKLWPNKDKTLTPVAEVEIWLNSVPLDVTFSPPFIIVTGLVKTSIERLIKVRNGTGHQLEMSFDNFYNSTGAISCHPSFFSVTPHATTTFKIVIFFERYGEIQEKLQGTMKLPFSSVPCFISTFLRAYGPFLEVLTPNINFGIVPFSSETMKTLALKNGGDRPLKWVARIAPDGMEDEHRREISGHQARIHDKRLLRFWPPWGVLGPGETMGMQVYFSAELSGEIASYIEVMVEGNPESLVSVPVYGEIELPSLVLENGVIKFFAEDFVQQLVQTGMCSIINPSGFNVPFEWQCSLGRQNKLCTVYIHPKRGIIPSKAKMDFTVNVESYLGDEPLQLDNLFVPCCVEGMSEPLILKIISEY